MKILKRDEIILMYSIYNDSLTPFLKIWVTLASMKKMTQPIKPITKVYGWSSFRNFKPPWLLRVLQKIKKSKFQAKFLKFNLKGQKQTPQKINRQTSQTMLIRLLPHLKYLKGLGREILEIRCVGLSKINVVPGTMWKLVHCRFIIAHRGHIDRTIGMMVSNTKVPSYLS